MTSPTDRRGLKLGSDQLHVLRCLARGNVPVKFEARKLGALVDRLRAKGFVASDWSVTAEGMKAMDAASARKAPAVSS